MTPEEAATGGRGEGPGAGTPERRHVVADGTGVLVRPIRPGDEALLADGFRRLSAGSRRRRFLAPIAEPTPTMLDVPLDPTGSPTAR